MVEKYLTGKEIGNAYFAGAVDGAYESGVFGKQAQAGGKPLWASLAARLGLGAKDVFMSAPALILSLAGAGLATGAAGGIMYNITKNRMSADASEKENEINKKISLYAARNKEIEDSMWMKKIREKRDELRKSGRNMTPEEYETKYNELLDALDERKGAYT